MSDEVVIEGGRYAVTRDGRVLSLRPRRRELRPTLDHKGYLRVSIAGQVRRRMRFIHHLVLEAFAGPRPSPTHQTRHLDGNKTNNHADNLRWGTPAENMRDSVRLQTTAKGDRIAQSVMTPESVLRLIQRSKEPGTTRAQLAREFGISKASMYAILSGESWSHVTGRRQRAG